MALTLSVLGLFAGDAAAKQDNYNRVLVQQPFAVQMLIGALYQCAEQQLPRAQKPQLRQHINDAIHRVEGYCQQKNEAHAQQTLRYYLRQPTGKAALKCLSELKPLTESPHITEYLAPHQQEIDDLFAGKAPSPICR